MKNSLQDAGTSLDISARIYGIRVDDVYADGMKLASMMAENANKNQQLEIDEEHGDSNREGEGVTKKKQAKRKRHGRKSTIVTDENSLLEDISQINPSYYQHPKQKRNPIENFYTSKLRMDHGAFRFLIK